MLLQVLPVPVFFVSILSALALPNLIATYYIPVRSYQPNFKLSCAVVVLSYLSPPIVLFNRNSPPPVYRAAI